MSRRWVRRATCAAVVIVALIVAGQRVIADVPTSTAAAATGPDPSPVLRPLINDCTGGHLVFTFDDGPRQHTPALLDRLRALHLTAVFFWIGHNVVGRRDVVQRALAAGDVIGNHTFDHPDLRTGDLPDGQQVIPWGGSQIRDELARTNQLLVSYGAPYPLYYRPPYGSIDPQGNSVAQRLGLRLVMSFGQDGTDNIVDSHDSDGASTLEIIANVTRAMTDQSIITMHDGLARATLNSIEALQAIVDVMNDRKLCATTEIRQDATGRALTLGAAAGGGD